jgi:hypothetical protein
MRLRLCASPERPRRGLKMPQRKSPCWMVRNAATVHDTILGAQTTRAETSITHAWVCAFSSMPKRGTTVAPCCTAFFSDCQYSLNVLHLRPGNQKWSKCAAAHGMLFEEHVLTRPLTPHKFGGGVRSTVLLCHVIRFHRNRAFRRRARMSSSSVSWMLSMRPQLFWYTLRNEFLFAETLFTFFNFAF